MKEIIKNVYAKLASIAKNFCEGKSHRFRRWLLIFLLPPVLISAIFLKGFVVARIAFNQPPESRVATTTSTESFAPFYKLAHLWLPDGLKINSYHVVVLNLNKVMVNGIVAELPYQNDPEVGAMELTFNKRGIGSSTPLYVPVNSIQFGEVYTDDLVSTDIWVIYRLPQKIPFMYAAAEDGESEPQGVASVGVNATNSIGIAFPMIGDFIVNFLVIFFGWIIVLNAIFEMIRISKKNWLKL